MIQIRQEQQNNDPEQAKDNKQNKSPNQHEKAKLLSESLHGEEIKKKRILAYQNKAPAPPDSHLNPMRVVYSAKTPMSTKSGTRFIPTNPERILDAPDFINDYCKYNSSKYEDIYEIMLYPFRS